MSIFFATKFFIKTTKDISDKEVSRNARLLRKAGYIFKNLAGVYTFLPIGLRVLRKIENIVRGEMLKIGAIEFKSNTLQAPDIWKASNRWDDNVVDVWFKTKLKNGQKLGLAFTHEEMYTDLLKHFVKSYKDLPIILFDIRDMFRNEPRAKSGLLRGREFYWKAAYSFAENPDDHNKIYEELKNAYLRIMDKLGIGDFTYLTFASGGTFSKYSHEFQTVCKVGEDDIYLDEDKKLAINSEVFTEQTLKDLGLNKANLKHVKAVEVGNIFTLGTKFPKALNLKIASASGSETFAYMGSYGIGISRIMGIIAEKFADKNGLIWPKNIAPFTVEIVPLVEYSKFLQNVLQTLTKLNMDILVDDRPVSAGRKLVDSDLLGIPYRIVISERLIKSNKVEVKQRATGKIIEVTLSSLPKVIK